jgi:hypothetical protein
MGLADQTQIDAADNVLRTGTFAEKLNFLRTTPLDPPDGYTGMALTAKTAAKPNKDWKKRTIRDEADMVGFIRIGAVSRDKVGALTFRLRYTREGLQQNAARAGLIPCWFLPWRSRQVMKLKIANVATSPTLDFGVGTDPVANPGLFFTAAISGCSVFVVGATAAPSVYHAGVTGSLITPMGPEKFNRLGGTSEAVWRSLLGRTATLAKPIGEVNRDHYVAERVGPLGGETDRIRSNEAYTTAQALMLEGQLQNRNDLTAVKVSPWGCVFGLRDAAGQWSFNLVKNATVEYYRVTRKKKLFGRVKTTQHGEMMPNANAMRPDGTIDMVQLGQLKNQYYESVISTCVNLGYHEFFPGANNAVYQDLGTISIV